MSATIKKLDKGQVELSFSLSTEEIAKDLENAAIRLSEERPLDGFRPGKAPFEMIKSRFGEMALYEAALPAIVRKNYVKTVEENDLHVYGEPSINVTALAPGNPVAFVATVAVVPSVTKLADHKKVKVESKAPTVPPENIEGALKELSRMQTVEVPVERAVTEKDKLVVDMSMSKDGVVVEGGTAKDHGIFLDEEYYVPGFREQVIGLKTGDNKKFSLKFPENHFQKHLAGTDVDFNLTVKAVHELQHPPLDDEFAKKLGQPDMTKLRALIEENMMKEASDKEEQRVEVEILEQLVAGSEFEEIPEKILNDEINRMLEELKHGVAERRVEFADYLQNINKTVDDLKLEFVPQAIKRIKTALVIRAVAEADKVEVSDAEILEETTRHLNSSADNAEMQAYIRSEEYEGYIRTNLRNRKVLAALRTQATK